MAFLPSYKEAEAEAKVKTCVFLFITRSYVYAEYPVTSGVPRVLALS
jgi:hypothetical protein